jgi:hypothetical protein
MLSSCLHHTQSNLIHNNQISLNKNWAVTNVFKLYDSEEDLQIVYNTLSACLIYIDIIEKITVDYYIYGLRGGIWL